MIIKNLIIKKFKIYKIFIILFLFYILLIHIIYNEIKRYKNYKKSFNGRIFDCFMYNNEAETAYIHIWRLYEYVDKFIILIADRTFSGLPKNYSFKPFEENLRPFMKKIDIVKLNKNICNRKEYPSYNSIWCFENSQRDYAKTYIEKHYNPTEEDLLLVVDIDEIFTKEGIEYVKQNPPKDFYFVKGSMYFPYYYLKASIVEKRYIKK